MAGISRPGDLPFPVKRLGRLAHETDTRAAVGDGKRGVILLSLQVDVLDEQRKQLSLCGLRSRRCGYSWLHSHRP
jgi:hypothetical protein